jgi:hypothetical protein
MRTTMKHASAGFLALALSALLVPAAVQAQEEGQQAQQQQECSAQVTPEAVEPGQSAVRVKAKLSSSVGQVQGFKAAGESGVTPADPADIGKKTGMTREEGQQPPQPVEMAAEDQTSAILWLNTEDASAGDHQVTLQGQNGTCSATVTVAAPEQQGEEEGAR